MLAIFILEKDYQKHNFFTFLKDHFLVMGGPIDMNVNVFRETSVGFLKAAVS